MTNVNLGGKGQARDGDFTTTGATCIAIGNAYHCEGRAVLRKGDVTTACPRCKQTGVIVESCPWLISDGQEVVMDGAVVACGCPSGSNRVLAPLNRGVPSVPDVQASARNAPPAPAYPSSADRHSQAVASTTPVTGEPGFYIVPRSMSGQQVLSHLFGQHTLATSRLRHLNPTFERGFKAGEIFVVGYQDNGHACTREEAQLIAAAEQARESLGSLSNDEADFMMRHQAEIAGLLGDVSLSMGVVQAMMTRSLEELQNTLRHIEHLHQREYAKHGHLRSPQFFASRKELFRQLDGQLRSAFLNKKMDLGSHTTLRRDLGISSKSVVHHWSKAGGPGQIPGYATHLDKLARMSKYLERGGQVGIVIGGVSSYLKIEEACRFGATEACRKIRFTEAGSFSVGLAGGAAGAKVGSTAAFYACLGFGPVGAPICGLALAGAGALVGSAVGMSVGESAGEFIFEVTER